MGTAFVFGLLGSSALVVGGSIGAWWDAPKRLTGIFLAFASGTLISALAFELFPDAVEMGGVATASAGLLIGALVFVIVNLRLDAATLVHAGDAEDLPMKDALSAETSQRLAPATADQREKVEELARRGGGGLTSGVGLALLAAVVLDGIPENVALGVSLVGEAEGSVNLALLVAIFASNLPESLVGGIAMRDGGRSRRFVVAIWTAAAAALTLAVVVGRGVVSNVGDGVVSFSLAFAGGAVLASLADTLMPEAFEHGRPLNALATAVGFLLSFVLATG